MADIKLPSGKVVKNVPKNISQSELKSVLLSNGVATEEDFEESFSVSGFLQENMEIPMGLGGSLAGAGTGFMVAGPVGAIVGGIIGGSLGSGAGSLTSDLIEGTDPDYSKALEEALISAGIDVVTLGLGSKVKPFLLSAKAARMTPNEAAELFVKEAAITAGEDAQSSIAKAVASEGLARTGSEVAGAGSLESLRESQRLAQESGASFTPSQTGQASSLQVLTEGIANLGLLSSSTMQRNAEKIENAAQGALSEIISKSSSQFDDPSQLGMAMSSVIEAGKDAAQTNYTKNIVEIRTKLGTKQASKAPLKVSLTKFLRKNERVLGSMLDDKTIKYVNKLQERLNSPGSKISVKELIDFQTKINGEIRKLGNLTSKESNPDLVPEFSQLSSNLRGVIQRALERADPALAKQYKETKKAYGIATQGILPELNKRYISSARKSDYTPLGKLLVGTGNVDQTRAMMKSIDEAYKLIPSSKLKELPIKTSEEAKAAIRSSFLTEKFSTVSGKFDSEAYVKMAAEFQQPSKAAKLSAILGPDTPKVKQVMNLISEASQEIEGNLGSLLFRSKEYRAAEAPIRVAGMVGQMGTIGAGISAGALDLLSSGLIITVPVVLAKISTNPKLANKLLAFEKKVFPTEEAKLLAINVIAEEAISSMTEEERRSLREEIRQVSSTSTNTRGQRKQEQLQQAVGQ
jgi:hypothetical protein|tara:strand:- start:280 stop:2349 length:2070 start_codon:yes stop_codon:yes gene_type:complete